MTDFFENLLSNGELQEEIAELKAENERLKEELEPYKHPDVITLLTNWRTGELDRTHNKIANERDKYRQTLQEIKAIAESPKPFKDFSETKTATEVEYDYAAICNELELRLHKVLELITKAEEE